jgi:hypothetical protein
MRGNEGEFIPMKTLEGKFFFIFPSLVDPIYLKLLGKVFLVG